MLGWLRKLFGGNSGRDGRLWIISAPSGAGKTSLVRELCRRQPDLEMSVSYTTRQRRPNEKDGHDYHFVDRQAFDRMVADGAFLEHAEVFGNFYATGRADVQAILGQGRNVILEIDWQGARQARAAMPGAGSIFILPPSFAELERRLRGRGSDSEEVIQRRLAEARDDMSHWHEFSYVVINDDFSAAADALEAILARRGEACRTTDPGLREKVTGLLA
ncbi:MAG: guanylate kinase [Gammaproteobacteria bacterium]|nr:guanylate kinase [Gammaproteobacteria bacterium]NNF62234.1 guanylate kinase [Gammaproteobacteria bacterium]NNM21031.1 guanylate kinase [Gammaproteobacteria bacterium]